MTLNSWKSWKRWCGFALVLLLVACSNYLQPTDRLGEMARDDFMYAMRWKRFRIAASLMQPEYRQDFMATFAELKGLHITDVRLVNLHVTDENRRFETTIEMDYYLPPSVTIKTFRFDQTWVYFAEDDPPQHGFLVVTPFPDFP